ncbi:MAG: hypothetical protein M1597_00930 [Candidatus Thermoplasmatota archaeon]|nr:hypothetical protein [Candidatus Thermoplasmatota archaeon]
MILILLFILPFLSLPIALFSSRMSYCFGIFFSSLISILSVILMLGYASAGSFAIGNFSIMLKGLNVTFLLIISVVELLVYIFSLFYMPEDKKLAFFVGLTIASINSVLLSGNVILFLMFWESMTISGYLLIGFKDETKSYPPFVFISFGELSTIFLMVGFAGYYVSTGTLALGASLNNPYILMIIILGFAFKMGIVPLQMVEWLPIAHGNSPTPGSILFSAAMTTLALYGIVEFILTSVPYFVLGLILMIIGAFSLLFGSIFALSSENSKMLPAYSTVENSGAMIILAGLLSIWREMNDPIMVAFVMLGIFVYATAHAWAKSSIFILSSISDNNNLPTMRGSGLTPFGRVGAAISAISLMGLVPLGGGIGEWLLLESLFISSVSSNLVFAVVAIVSGAMAALGAGIAIPTFTKYFGFITKKHGNPESGHRISTPMKVSGAIMLSLTVLAPAYVYMYSYFIGTLKNVGGRTIFLSNLKGIIYPFLLYSPQKQGFFGLLSPPFDILFIVVAAAILSLLAKGKERKITVWNGGLGQTEEVNSFAYANTLRIILKKVYLSKEEREGTRYQERTFDIFWIIIIDLAKLYSRFSGKFGRFFMNGNINRYVQYIIIALFIVLVMVIL